MPRMSVRSVRTSLRLRAISGLPGVPADRAEPVEGRGDLAFRVVGRDLVAGDLLGQEAVERLVAVQRVDHVVAEPPGVGDVPVVLVPLGLGEPDHVEPVLRPALAVAGAGEQPVDQPLVGVGRRVGDERVDLLGRGRQAGQVERDPADHSARLAAGRASSPSLRVRQDEGVDGVRTRGIRGVGGFGFTTGWNAQCRRASSEGRGRRGARLARVDGPLIDPGSKSAMTGSASFGFLGGISRPSSWRMAWIRRLSPGLAGDDRRAGVAPSEHPARESRSRPPFTFSAFAEWQPKQDASRTGRIFSAKSNGRPLRAGRQAEHREARHEIKVRA